MTKPTAQRGIRNGIDSLNGKYYYYLAFVRRPFDVTSDEDIEQGVLIQAETEQLRLEIADRQTDRQRETETDMAKT